MGFGIRNFAVSAFLGVVWGWAAMTLNSFTYAFRYEAGFLHNIVIFTIGGAVFGIVVGGFIWLFGDLFPFKGRIPRAVAVSVFLWLLLFGGGLILSGIRPDRYHFAAYQAMQGFFLSIVLGIFFGIFLVFDRRS